MRLPQPCGEKNQRNVEKRNDAEYTFEGGKPFGRHVQVTHKKIGRVDKP